jgi:hypothetical protein
MDTACSKHSKYADIAQQIRELPPEKPCSSYEWEELVQKMCASHDDGLHAIGVRERGILQQKCPNCPVFASH